MVSLAGLFTTLIYLVSLTHGARDVSFTLPRKAQLINIMSKAIPVPAFVLVCADVVLLQKLLANLELSLPYPCYLALSLSHHV